MNGFVKVVRGVDNLAIESDCTWVSPDLAELKRVSGRHPSLGGSHYGLVDMDGSVSQSSSQSVSQSARSEKLFASAESLPGAAPQQSGWLSMILLAALLLAAAALAWVGVGKSARIESTKILWSRSSEYVSLP